MLRVLFPLICLALCPPLGLAADDYPPGPDSKPQEGVPKGEVLKFTFDRSKIFPGTTREYSVYIPNQYDPAKPPCLYVNQDGIQYGAPVVFDNLIARGEIPVVIGVFVPPGKVKALQESALDRFNRSFEYDGLGDAYARFLIEGIAAGRGDEKHLGRPPDPLLEKRQRSHDRRLEQRRHRRVDGCVGAPRGVQPRLHERRHVRRFARRQRLSHAHPQVGAEADPHLSAGRLER